MSGPETVVDLRRQRRLAVLLVGECQEPHRHSAGDTFAMPVEGPLEAAPVGFAREQLVTPGQIHKCHRLHLQRMNHMVGVDNMDGLH